MGFDSPRTPAATEEVPGTSHLVESLQASFDVLMEVLNEARTAMENS